MSVRPMSVRTISVRRMSVRHLAAELGDACGEACVAISIDDEVTGRNRRELVVDICGIKSPTHVDICGIGSPPRVDEIVVTRRAAEAEPWSATIRPGASMCVTRDLDRIDADRYAHERHRGAR